MNLISETSTHIQNMGKSVSDKGIFSDDKSKKILLGCSSYLVLILYAIINLIFVIITL
ncbi:hypothetical protein GOQ27_04090 [Clostridium sp. D2Q-11]|uniref:Uncharacterized protein n=1 Tax=Anaeromonas frigoriresistens TaxID=2683708 RepID=A0A942UQX4_9FIRM|nr:hypothetical protein [Anaeromonas frigoriresistens]MBS4537629.1 hypothetical protein [Anaeromonas frigoriresistens]